MKKQSVGGRRFRPCSSYREKDAVFLSRDIFGQQVSGDLTYFFLPLLPLAVPVEADAPEVAAFDTVTSATADLIAATAAADLEDDSLCAFSNSLFLAASSLCRRISAKRAKSARASSVLPSACNLAYLSRSFCFSISSLSRRDSSTLTGSLDVDASVCLLTFFAMRFGLFTSISEATPFLALAASSPSLDSSLLPSPSLSLLLASSSSSLPSRASRHFR